MAQCIENQRVSTTNRSASALGFMLFWATAAMLSSCYSLKSSSIPQDVQFFFVKNFDVRAANAPANLGIVWTEALKDKIRGQSRLRLNPDSPDCEFSGSISGFSVRPVAPKVGEAVSFNQLLISISVDYVEFTGPDRTERNRKQFEKQYFVDFSASTDLLSVQDQLIEQSFKQLTGDVFNEAFNNW